MTSTVLVALLIGCQGSDDTSSTDVGPAPSVAPAQPALRRLTATQYDNAVTTLFGEGLVLPTSLEPDSEIAGLLSVGAAVSSVSSFGVELYESAAYLIAEQVTEDAALRANFYPCEPVGPSDEDCAAQLITEVGRVAWRRPLTAEEIDRLTTIVTAIGESDEDFHTGAMYAISAILQSPSFLYRTEHGTPDPLDPDRRRLTDFEIATRLSFLLWNTLPDDELLLAAESGELSTSAGLEVQARRMLSDDNASAGVRNLFTELLGLYELDDLSKDPTAFTHASPDLGPSAREETLLLIEALLLEDDADFRELFTTQRTFVDRRLAALYSIAAPTEEGFGEVWLDEADGRRGLLGHASVLALHSHPTSTSATLRGKFVRTVLLCHEIPPPPGDVDTSIPEADADSPTLRERIASHLEDPSCASCHQITDPVGLGLENFDGIGRWRDTENDAMIDASGDLDGATFSTAWGLGERVAAHDDLGRCMSGHVFQYATGHPIEEGEEALVDWLAESFADSDYSFQDLLIQTILSDSFTTAGAIQ
ncbi:MAG: hypothetical protein ACI8RZ_001786 [Myxococcota bacterium]|jgi:hypothetical protein